MPVWHAATKALRAAGDLTVIGIVQEQHPERAQLYAQWQGLDFPILWDAFNLLDLSAVPIVCAVDEHGQVRSTRFRPDQVDQPRGLRKAFAERSFDPPVRIPQAELLLHQGLRDTGRGGRPGSPLATLNALAFLVYDSRSASQLRPSTAPATTPNEAAAAQYDGAVKQLLLWANRDEALPADLFRLGVALRLRYDSPYGRPQDFQDSLDAWGKALDLQPSQYIWRRRIQQWGPRLDKPYPFYNWVDRASTELAARGETPVALRVPLTGSERAGAPQKGASAEATPEAPASNPDPEAKIPLDEGGWLQVTSAVAVHSGASGRGGGQAPAAARVHLVLEPKASDDVHWGNDAGASVVWIDAPAGWSLSKQLHVLESPQAETSKEVRSLDFELLPGSQPAEGGQVLKGYVLAYLCSGESGECRYLRHGFEVRLPSLGR